MRIVATVFFLFLVPFLNAAGVKLDMTRLEVESALGKPMAVMQRGERLVLSFPKGGRVELVNDRVVDMVAVLVATDGSPPAKRSSIPAIEAEEASEDEVGPPASEAVVENAKGASAAKPTSTAKPATETFPQPAEQEPASDKPDAGVVLQLLVGAVIRIAIVMVVLKMAFNWADVHADWGQMFLPALADTVVRSIFVIVGVMILEVTDWFYVDEAVAYFVLLFVLMKNTHACTLSRAFAVAFAAKLMSILVGGLITVYVLHMLS